MMLAQKLYEGIEIGSDGQTGLITYMRTDSIRVSGQAIDAVREYIVSRYGKEHLPEKPIFYKGKKGAQDAHEAIRPTSMEYPPEVVADYLDKDMQRLYELIWKRFVASQMNPAVFDQTAFDIDAGEFRLRATGQVMRFPGFISVYLEGVDDEAGKDEEENPVLPNLEIGERLELIGIEPHQHFTQPPPRFTEASLVKELEEKGIGRPSTYASIMSVIQDKGYVRKVKNRFFPSELGKLVNELLVKNFPRILDVGFTARMEEELDEVEEGKLTWVAALNDFYDSFESQLAKARENMRDVKRQTIDTQIKCDLCGKNMVIKWGRHGEFLACSQYPDCRSTKEFTRNEEDDIVIQKTEDTGEVCDKCGKAMLIKRGRFGEFLACSGYPECKNTKSISTGVKCPRCGKGELVQKTTRRAKMFYGCSRYPECDYATWDRPIAEQCPECGFPILVEKYSKKSGESTISCPQKECHYKKTV
jgi:DNA topoisomerase-1